MASGGMLEDRKRSESRYFQSSLWKEQNLDADRVGVTALRTFSAEKTGYTHREGTPESP